MFGVIMLLSITSFGTDFNFKYFSTKDGLPNNYINDIYQDSDGFIWIATRDDISRYDGYNFITYNTLLSDNQKIPSFSKYIFESTDGKLWVFGPSINSYYFDGKDFHQYSNNYTFGYPDNESNIWFVNDSSLIKIDTNNLRLSTKKSKDNNLLQLICKERNNEQWAFQKFSLPQISESTNHHFTSFLFNNRYIINSTYIDSKNNIWIGTSNNGLIKFNPETNKFHYYKSKNNTNGKLIGNEIFKVYEIDKSTIWISSNKGINVLNTDDNTFNYITRNPNNKNELSDNKVTSIFIDNSGTLFIGTRLGLNIVTKQRFKHFSKSYTKNSFLSNNVHGFIEDELQNIWIISSGGLDSYNTKKHKIKNYPVNKNSSNSIKSSPITIIADEKNNFWIGTWQGGIYYFNTKTQTFKQYNFNYGSELQLGHNSVMSVFKDNQNEIWCGTWGGGLYKYDKDKSSFKVKQTTLSPDLLNNEISTITQDNFGRLWIGTMNGLNLYNCDASKKIKTFTNNTLVSLSISNNQINTLFISDSNLWVGTSYGLNRINLNTLVIDFFFTIDGLPSNKIMAITDDNNGDLWVTTGKGLAKIIHNSNNKMPVQILTVNPSIKLQSDNFLDRSILKTKNGNILLGGTNGFNMFNPNNISFDTITTNCIFTELTIDDKKINVGDSLFGKPILTQPLTKTKSITLSYKHYNFSLEFASLDYSSPNEIKYKYMLKGFDEEWRYTDSENRAATYSNINKGEYELIVYAANINDFWNKAPLILKIKVIPPWWRTIVFYISFGLFIIFLFITFYKLRVRILKKQKRQLEDTVVKRTKQLTETNTYLEDSKKEIQQQNKELSEINTQLEKSHEEIKLQNERLSYLNSQLEDSEEEITQQNSELLKHRDYLEEMITERTNDLEIAKLKAEESDRLKSAFLANMSHEIRTPLNAIVGFSSLFKEVELSKEDIDQYVNIIINNSNSLSTIINDIIDISVIEAGQLKLNPSYFNVDKVLLELVSTYKLKNSNNLDIVFVKNQNQNDLILYTDEVRFRQIMTNILNNACKFTRKGFIKFGYNIRNSYIEFFIHDSGSGIQSEDKENIFKYFQKISPTPDKFYSGTGLGLTICQELITKMGGKIWFESEKDKGSKFMFTIPHS